MFKSPSDIFLSFWGINIYYYGLFIALAVIIGFLISSLVMRKYYPDLNRDNLYDLMLWVIPFGILGARIYYVLLCLGYYMKNPLEIFMIQNGGLSIHGALIGGILGGYIFLKRRRLSFFKYADILSYGLPVAQAIGRIGNFFNSEAYGKPTELPWSVFIPVEKRHLEYIDYSTYHPTFLYEGIGDIFIFLILFFLIRKIFDGKDGGVFFSYLILYSAFRLVIESVRIDSVLNIFGIPIASCVSILIICISSVFLHYKKEKKNVR